MKAPDEEPFLMSKRLMKIAIQGFEGCYHQVAAEHYMHSSIDCVPCRTFRELVKTASSDKQVDGAIMAIENSIAGSIIPNYTLLLGSDLKIVGEIYTRISHQLMVLPGQTIDDLKEVHSHPMAIEQCRKFFDGYPDIHLVETADTALSARNVSENNEKTIGAIAGKRAAELYGLDIIGAGIETVKNNYTRFLILSREHALNGNGANKASLHFKVHHGPGSLQQALEIFTRYGINLSKIQSFPVIEKEWQYYFHCDLEFQDRQQYEEAINALKPATEMLNILGVYKKGETIL